MNDNEFMLLLHSVVEAAAKRWPGKDDFDLFQEIEERLRDVMDERNPA